MAKALLDNADRRSRHEQVRCVRVPQRMEVRGLVDVQPVRDRAEVLAEISWIMRLAVLIAEKGRIGCAGAAPGNLNALLDHIHGGSADYDLPPSCAAFGTLVEEAFAACAGKGMAYAHLVLHDAHIRHAKPCQLAGSKPCVEAEPER